VQRLAVRVLLAPLLVALATSGAAPVAGASRVSSDGRQTGPVTEVLAALDAPLIVGPSGGGTSANPTFEWQPVPGAVSYRVWIDETLSTGNPPIETVNTKLTDVIFQRSTHVDWWVAAVDGDGVESAKSQASFDVGPLIPTLVAPLDGASFTFPQDSPALAWQAALDGGSATYYIDGRVGEDSIPDQAGAGGYRADIGGAPGSWRWTAGQVVTPPPGTAPIRTFTVSWPNSTPVLAGPADGAVLANSAPTLSWSRIDGAYGYDVQIDEDAAFSSPISAANQRLLEMSVYPLASGTWHWRVRAREPMGGAGAWSLSRSFVVPDVAIPTIIGPADSVSLTEYPILQWQPVPGADGYQIEVTSSIDDPNISNRSVDGTAFVLEPPGWQTYAPVPFGPGPQTLHWRVRATFLSGGYQHGGLTDWTVWRSLTVDPPDGSTLGAATAATLVAPARCADIATCPSHPSSPALDWESVDGAAFYRVFLQNGGDGTGPSSGYYDTAGSTYQYFMSTTESVVGWGVIACPSIASCPESMNSLPGRYLIKTPSPAVVGPADGAHSVDPAMLLSWIPAAIDPTIPTTPISWYEVGLETKINGDWSSWPGALVPGAQTAAAVTGIHVGSDWRWRLRAVPVIGPPSAWSSWRAFDRPPLPPTITAPADGATTNSTPRLTWDAVASTADGYRVDIVRGTPVAPGDWVLLQQWHYNVAGRSFDVYPNLAPGEYTWRVSAGDVGLADIAPLASVGHFVVAAADPPVLVSPAAGSSLPDDRGVFTWQAVDGAATYRVDVATDPDFAAEHLVDGGSAWGTTWAMRQRLPAGPIYWRVIAFAPGYQVIGSAQADFTIGTSEVRLAMAIRTIIDTVPPTVTAPHYALATGSLVSGATPVQLTWTGSDALSGVDHYLLSLQKDGGAWSAPTTVVGTSVTRALAPGHRYRVRVQAVDRAHNTSGLAYGTTFRLTAVSQSSSSVHYHGKWATSTLTTWWGGTARSSSTAGSTATYVFTGRSISWVGLKAVTRGKAAVFVNGVRVATIDLYSATTQRRWIVWRANYATSATRTLTIKVLGTSGRPRVDLDGFIVGS
jgi:hypothetical protein